MANILNVWKSTHRGSDSSICNKLRVKQPRSLIIDYVCSVPPTSQQTQDIRFTGGMVKKLCAIASLPYTSATSRPSGAICLSVVGSPEQNWSAVASGGVCFGRPGDKTIAHKTGPPETANLGPVPALPFRTTCPEDDCILALTSLDLRYLGLPESNGMLLFEYPS